MGGSLGEPWNFTTDKWSLHTSLWEQETKNYKHIHQLPYFQNNLLYVSRQENSMQLQSLFCHLRLSFLGTILDLWFFHNWRDAGTEGYLLDFYTSWFLYKVGPKEGTFSAHPRIDPVTGQMYFFSGMFFQVHINQKRWCNQPLPNNLLTQFQCSQRGKRIFAASCLWRPPR